MEHSYTHWLWAGLGALAMFPLKKLWDWWIERFWTAFWMGFKENFKKTPEGQAWLKQYYEARAAKDAELAKQHPEIEPMLHCKECQGKGCEHCGGTGWA